MNSVSSERIQYSFLKKVLDGNLWIQCISQDPVSNTKTTLTLSTERTYRALVQQMLKVNRKSETLDPHEITAGSIHWAEETKESILVVKDWKLIEWTPTIWESDLRGAGITWLVLVYLRRHNKVALGSTKRIWRIKQRAAAEV